MTTESVLYSSAAPSEAAKSEPTKGISWRNTLALTLSSVLGVFLTVVLSPLLLVAATWLWFSKMLGR